MEGIEAKFIGLAFYHFLKDSITQATIALKIAYYKR